MLKIKHIIATGFIIAGIESLKLDSVSSFSLSFDWVLAVFAWCTDGGKYPGKTGLPYPLIGFLCSRGDGVGVDPPLYTTCILKSLNATLYHRILHKHAFFFITDYEFNISSF